MANYATAPPLAGSETATPKAAPPKRPPIPTPQAPPASNKALACVKPKPKGEKIGIYGTGGIGKTSLVKQLGDNIMWFDLDESLSALGFMDESTFPAETYTDIRAALAAPGWEQHKHIVFDSATKLEELVVDHVLKTVPAEKGTFVKRLEDYGYGKGVNHVYEAFLPLLADLDRHVRAGRNVVFVIHVCTNSVPNPEGEDYLRYEPRLQDPKSGKGSIRLRLKEWLDHLFFIGYDQMVDKDGKRTGVNTRTLYPVERSFCMAKSRTLNEPIVILPDDDTLWRELGV